MKGRPRTSLRRVGLLLGGLLALWMWTAPAAHADSDGAWLDDTRRYTSRSLFNLRVSAYSGIPDLVGVSATLTALRPFELEAGLSTLGLAATFYTKIGGAIPLANTRDSKGWGVTLDLVLMLGYRHLFGGFDTRLEAHGMTATVGLDFTWWLTTHLGLTAHLNGGGGLWLYHSSNAPRLFPDVRFSIGLAF